MPRTSRLKKLFRPRVLVSISLLLFLAVCWPYLLDSLPELTQDSQYLLSSEELHITTPPRWVPGDLISNTLSRAGLALPQKPTAVEPPAGSTTPATPSSSVTSTTTGSTASTSKKSLTSVTTSGASPSQTLSVLNEEVPARLGQAFAASPWVRTVRSVRMLRQGGIEVALEYRTPVAMIETPRGLYPVDHDGVLLPPEDFSASEASLFPLVRKVSTSPQGPAGTAWGDLTVVGAARLAEILSPQQDLEKHWKRLDLQAILAPEPSSIPSTGPHSQATLKDLSFELLTRTGSHLLWGKPPGGDQLEPSPEQKLGRLQHYLSTYGSFDKPRGACRIDIRDFKVISLYPLESAEAVRR